MILIVGLGNPGKKYEHTPHNFGFYTVDALREMHRLPAWKHDESANALIARGVIAKRQALLAKPQTFMNKSGQAVKKLASRFNIPSQNIWLAHDDADLPFGTLRISQGRGSAGHKGIESIIHALKSKDMVRFRMGSNMAKKQITGRKLSGTVLKRFSRTQEKIAKDLSQATSRAIKDAIVYGIPRAMTEYNRK